MRPRPSLAGLAAALTLCAPELAYWAGARACPRISAAGSCGVLVMGFPPRRDGSPHPMQRHRVGTGAEVFRRAGCSVMVLSGGTPHSSVPEAEVMAGLAREAGIAPERIIVEKRARNTWENVRYSLKDIEAQGTLYLVSDSLHVHRAKRYLCRQRVDLCSRARSAARYRPGELYGLKWVGVLHEAVAWARDLFRGIH